MAINNVKAGTDRISYISDKSVQTGFLRVLSQSENKEISRGGCGGEGQRSKKERYPSKLKHLRLWLQIQNARKMWRN